MDLKVNYLGLELKNPIIAASSPLTMTIERIEKLQQHEVGAVVLKSVFEEQVMQEAEYLNCYSDYPEAADYLNNYVQQVYLDGHLKLVSDIKERTDLPVIASINCRTGDTWQDYACSLAQAGADALEVNLFILPTHIDETAEEIENRYYEIIEGIVSSVNLPVSIKLGMRFTNILNVCREIFYRKAKGVVLFNRFFEPDIDIQNMQMVAGDSLSERSEMRNIFRTVGMLSPQLRNLDISVTSGVHEPEDVIKSILTGAKTVQLCTALYHHGLEIIPQMNRYMGEWMESRGFTTVDEFRGLMSYKPANESELYQRVQYMKFILQS